MEMNADLNERFSRGNSARRDKRFDDGQQSDRQKRLYNPAIQQYYDGFNNLSETSDWRALPEIPTASELLRKGLDPSEPLRPGHDGNPQVEGIAYQNMYPSAFDYLSNHYKFCREETTYALRTLIAALKAIPAATEPQLKDARLCSAAGLYEKAFVTGVNLTRRGIATRMSFSTYRCQVDIVWGASKRLMQGSLVVITPAKDMFATQAIVGVVAARSETLIEKDPPEVEIFCEYDNVLDPSVEYLLIEERSTYFEAHRNNMLALQRMAVEKFPHQSYLIDPDNWRNIAMPQSIQNSPVVDFGAAVDQPSCPINVVSTSPYDFFDTVDQTKPANPNVVPSLDVSQMKALFDMLTKEIALIQGPPGTGKTHVSVVALRVMLATVRGIRQDPPIILTCQTNHALDQLLRHISKFEPNFVRLGGRSKDETIKTRTPYEIREAFGLSTASQLLYKTRSALDKLAKAMAEIIKPLEPVHRDAAFFDHHILYHHGVITEAQYNSLINVDKGWVQSELENPSQPDLGQIQVWLRNNIRHPGGECVLSSMGFPPVQEEAFDQELLEEMVAEQPSANDPELKGEFVALRQHWTSASPTTNDRICRTILNKHTDLRQVDSAIRGMLYHYMVQQCKAKIFESFGKKVSAYQKLCREYNIHRLEADLSILNDARIIGTTTTGFSKYRALIAATGAKIVLIEEAGESLECTLAPVFVPSIERVILVGDHKQLRARPQKREHADFATSMLERLINGGMEMTMLKVQRRMHFEISRLIRHFYDGELKDHPDTRNHALVPGMGRYRTFFVDHGYFESRDAEQSSQNLVEAEWIAAFAGYLIRRGTPAKNISILTFYNGQRKLIERELAQRSGEHAPGVFTVDSFQGEENRIILLSTVRNNDNCSVGFIADQNRINVALSRAQDGMYIFGNACLLGRSGGRAWYEVMRVLEDNPTIAADSFTKHPAEPDDRISDSLVITCGCNVSSHATSPKLCKATCGRKHSPQETHITHPDELIKLNGGCHLRCLKELACGHNCVDLCHPEVCVCNSCMTQLKFTHPLPLPSLAASSTLAPEISDFKVDSSDEQNAALGALNLMD